MVALGATRTLRDQGRCKPYPKQEGKNFSLLIHHFCRKSLEASGDRGPR